MLFDLAIVPNVKDVIVPLIFGALVLGWVPIVAAAISAIGSYMAARQQAKGAQNVDLPEYSGRYFEGIRAKKSAKQAYKTLLDIMNARGATDPRLLNRELTGIQRGTETQTQDMEQYLAQLGLTGSGTGQAMRAAIGQAGQERVAGAMEREAALQEARKRDDLRLMLDMVVNPNLGYRGQGAGVPYYPSSGGADAASAISSFLGAYATMPRTTTTATAPRAWEQNPKFYG